MESNKTVHVARRLPSDSPGTVKFQCPSCAKRMSAPRRFVGSTLNCRKCGLRLTIDRAPEDTEPPVSTSTVTPAVASHRSAKNESPQRNDKSPIDVASAHDLALSDGTLLMKAATSAGSASRLVVNLMGIIGTIAFFGGIYYGFHAGVWWGLASIFLGILGGILWGIFMSMASELTQFIAMWLLLPKRIFQDISK